MALSIIIIGAGAAGLFAARRLAEAGFAVTVVEAAAGPGGRIHSITPAGFSGVIEGAAEFIHGELPLSLQLAKEAGIPLLPLNSQMVRLQQAGDGSPEEFPGDDWGTLLEAMGELKEDEPVAVFMANRFGGDRYAGLRETVRRFAEGYDLADVNRVSTRALYEEWSREGEDEEYRPEGGYCRMIDFLASEARKHGATLHFGLPVVRVDWRPGLVTVTTASGKTFSADRLVTSVSLGVLDKIIFHPVLPRVGELVRQLGYGSVVKILLEFETNRWITMRKKGQTLFVISEEAVPVWWTQASDDSRLLTGWLAGGAMQDFLRLDKEAQLDACLQSLANIFSIEKEWLREWLQGSLILDWAAAPYVRGGYSFEAVGAPEVRQQLRQPIEETLYFCGEALYEGIAPGTVEAAFTSGQVVAEKIIAQDRPVL